MAAANPSARSLCSSPPALTPAPLSQRASRKRHWERGTTAPSAVLLTVLLLAALLLVACGGPATSIISESEAPAEDSRSVTLREMVGKVSGRASSTEPLGPVSLGFQLDVGGALQTGEASRARLDLGAGAILRVAADTALVLEANDGLTARVRLTAGKLWINLAGGVLEVETPAGVASVSGSFAILQYDPATHLLRFDCLEGRCAARNEAMEAQFGNLERLVISATNFLREPLTAEDVQNFLRDNPDSLRLLATLTAAPGDINPIATATLTPAPADAAASLTSIPINPFPSSTPGASFVLLGVHVVQAQETLFCIARGYGVAPQALAAANGLTLNSSVSAGMPLNIPAVRWETIAPGPACPPQFPSPFVASPTLTPSPVQATQTPTPPAPAVTTIAAPTSTPVSLFPSETPVPSLPPRPTVVRPASSPS